MTTMIEELARFSARAARLAVGFAIMGAMCAGVRPQSAAITITLAGQSMIRSDIRATAPAAVPVIQELLKGDVRFTNLESAVAEKGETAQEGRGFITPPEALDALTTCGFNLLAFSGNHAFDLKATGIQNTIREADSRKIIHAGTGKQPGRSGSAGLSAHAKGHDCPNCERVGPDYAGRKRHRGTAGRERASRGSRRQGK